MAAAAVVEVAIMEGGKKHDSATTMISSVVPKQGEAVLAEEEASFESVFGPLAHHLFPEGVGPAHCVACPTDAALVRDVWRKMAVSRGRSVVSADEARAAIVQLRTKILGSNDNSTAATGAAAGGRLLQPGQLLAVALCAVATLPSSTCVLGGVGGGSRLVDGTCTCFVDLITCLIPQNQTNNPQVPPSVILLLVSAMGRCPDHLGKVAVLRWFTLCVRTGCLRSPISSESTASLSSAREVLSRLYGVLFGMLKEPAVRSDAVRLLHAMTRRRHVQVHRAQRLRTWYLEGTTSQKTRGTSASSNSNTTQPLLLLLQLYAQYDPDGCGQYFTHTTRLGGRFSRYFQFPDEEWERIFELNIRQGQQQRLYEMVVEPQLSESTNDTNSSSSSINNSNGGNYEQSAAKSLESTIKLLEHSFEGVHSCSWELLSSTTSSRNHGQSIRASDLLQNESLRQLILLSCQSSNNDGTRHNGVTETEVLRLRACLPHMLHEEWYEQDNDDSNDDDDDDQDEHSLGDNRNEFDEFSRSQQQNEDSSDDDNDNDDENDFSSNESTCHDGDNIRDNVLVSSRRGRRTQRGRNHNSHKNKVRVVQALASLAQQADSLPPEAEAFLLEEIVPFWDGSGDTIGVTLCHELLSLLTPMSTFRELQHRLLRHLSKLYVCGSPRIKFAIVSGALSSLVRRWGRLDWQTASISWRPKKKRKEKEGVVPITTHPPSISEFKHMKQRVMHELVQWVDHLVLMGLIAEESSSPGGHELVRLSALDFCEAASEISQHCDFVAPPSPALIYRLLLSNTALCVDRVCHVLLKYKSAFETIKARSLSSSNDGTIPKISSQKNGLEKVALFNCFIWDFCSVLWRCSPLPALNPPAGGQVDMARANSILFTDIPHETLLAFHQFHSSHDVKVTAALSITHGAIFAGFASRFLKQHLSVSSSSSQNNSNRTFSPDLLRGKLKLKYLNYLKKRGFVGLYTFLTTFVGSLAQAEKRKAQQQLVSEQESKQRKKA